MAHPDPKRYGSEKGQREHAGHAGEASDAGMQSGGQGATSHSVRSDSGGPVPDTGLDRDSGAGTSGGRDTGGSEGSRNARRSQGRSGS